MCRITIIHYLLDRMVADTALPSFADPPLSEVALSVQFDPLPKLSVALLGLAWAVFRREFPTVQYHPPLDPIVERTGVPPPPSGMQFLMSGYPPPRLWFLNIAESELIQLQQDRFVRNWRRIGRGDIYPRYEQHVRPSFDRDYRKFFEFLEAEGVGSPVASQCEVTYVNTIEPGRGWKNHNEVGSVLKILNPVIEEMHGLSFEDATVALRQRIESQQGAFLGRLHIAIEPAYLRTDNSPIIKVSLTARGNPQSPNIDGVLEFFDLGHRHIVNAFTAMTTDKMHKEWRRTSA